MFCGAEALPVAELDRQADTAVQAFLAAYGQPGVKEIET
jgi:hypothetical protein